MVAHQERNEACDWINQLPDNREETRPRDARNALARQLESYKGL